jgi:hypothetical protein
MFFIFLLRHLFSIKLKFSVGQSRILFCWYEKKNVVFWKRYLYFSIYYYRTSYRILTRHKILSTIFSELFKLKIIWEIVTPLYIAFKIRCIIRYNEFYTVCRVFQKENCYQTSTPWSFIQTMPNSLYSTA